MSPFTTGSKTHLERQLASTFRLFDEIERLDKEEEALAEVDTDLNSGGSGIPGLESPSLMGEVSIDDGGFNIADTIIDRISRRTYRETLGDAGLSGAIKSKSRAAVVAMARKYAGVPYVWGGSSPSGWDCSGFVQYVFTRNGLRGVPRVSYQQANWGTRVSRKALRPGDLVAWNNSSRNNGADHIAIYLGNGKIAEAPRSGVPTRIRTLGSNEGAFYVRVRYPGE